MDASKSDVDFDSYWEEEARNPNRNRIRIGRQYQAQVTPLLQPGETDGRKLEELETLSWNPENSLSFCQLQQYFSIAKAIGLFVQAVDTCHEGLEEDDEDEEERPFEILQLGPNAACEETNSIFNTGLSTVATPEKQSITTRQQRLQLQKEQQSSVDSEPGSSTLSPLKHTSNIRIQNALKGLSAFISSHHSVQKEKRCKFASARENTEHPPLSLGSSENYSLKTLSDLLMGEWTANEAQIFARALQVCGKNFSAIKKDYLPWKSVRSIIEFYYYSVDQEGEQHRKKSQKSPLDEGKRKRSSRDSGSDSNSSSKSNEKVEDVNDTNGNNDNGNGASLSATDSQADSAKCSNRGEDVSKDGLHSSDVISLVKSSIPKNGFLMNDVPLTSTKALYGNINGNHALASDNRRNCLPGQEVKPLRAKPIVQNEIAVGGGEGTDNSFLGSLNLYLHGELVLKLNAQAQQQEAGQANVKWVESMEASPKKKRHFVGSNGQANSPRQLSGLKRSIDSKVGLLFKEDLDDLSTCGGDVSGLSEDDSGSDESSSLVASSPSSSSTSTAAKKARVKVENLSSTSNGPSISPPMISSRKSESSNGKQRTVSPSVDLSRALANENISADLELQKKLLLEANLFRLGGGLFEPPGTVSPIPKAHSNAPAPSPPQYPPHHPLHVANASPVKSVTPKTESSVNGHTNGVVASSTGPVDLTRKLPVNGHCSERLFPASLHSPSRRSPSVPKAAHESSTAALSPSRLVANSLGLFSLPALPPLPTNVPPSPNGHTKQHLKKSSLIRGGVHK